MAVSTEERRSHARDMRGEGDSNRVYNLVVQTTTNVQLRSFGDRKMER